MRQPRILVIDAAGSRSLPYATLVARLQPLELRVEKDVATATRRVAEGGWDIALLTAREPTRATSDVTALREADASLPIVVIDASGSGRINRRCLKAGASDCLDLDRAEADLEDALVDTLTHSRSREREQVLRRAVERPYSFEEFLGESPPMRKVYAMIDRVATSGVDVLVTGETGTGKELVARALHRRSRRSTGPFVPVDCGAIPDALLESELFGHERGAFTGADTRRMGLIEVADGGTLFLDEVGELPLVLQAKLLRVLQERRVRRVGARLETPVDVRVVAATSRDLDAMVAGEAFRRDLFYRINVVRIDLPPLRDRGDDIGLLAEYFANRAGHEMGRGAGRLSSDAYQVLRHYRWPGNVRELQNAVRRAMALAPGDVAGADDLPDEIVAASGGLDRGEVAEEGFFAQRAAHVAKFERQYLTELLGRHGGDVTAAAREARIPRGTLYRLMKGHELDGASFRRER